MNCVVLIDYILPSLQLHILCKMFC